MDRMKSLEVLENDFWGEPEFDSYLVTTCHRLRKIPIQDLSPENLRMLIGQEIGLEYLLPIAFELLEESLLVAGDMYEGDLLCAVAQVSSKFWNSHTELKHQAISLLKSVNIALETLQGAISDFNRAAVK